MPKLYHVSALFSRFFAILCFRIITFTLSLLCAFIFMCFSMPLLGASGTRGWRRGRSPCPDALLRVGDDGLYSALIGVLMDGIEWWVTSVFWRINFEAIEGVVIEGVLMCWLPWLFLIRAVHCCLFAQSLLCLRSPLPFFYYNFTGSDFGLWNEKRVHFVLYETIVLL